jgi:hypothetical protein
VIILIFCQMLGTVCSPEHGAGRRAGQPARLLGIRRAGRTKNEATSASKPQLLRCRSIHNKACGRESNVAAGSGSCPKVVRVAPRTEFWRGTRCLVDLSREEVRGALLRRPVQPRNDKVKIQMIGGESTNIGTTSARHRREPFVSVRSSGLSSKSIAEGAIRS